MKLRIEVRETIFKVVEIDLDCTDYDRESHKGKHEIIAELLSFPLKDVAEEELKTEDSEEIEVLEWDITK